MPVLFDTAPIVWLQSWERPWLTLVMEAISLAGYPSAYMVLGAAIALAGRLRQGAALLVLVALTAAMTDAGKALLAMPRPPAVDPAVRSWGPFQPAADSADTYGFPSGHAAGAVAFPIGLALLLGWRRAWPALPVWVLLTGLSRLYLGRHFIGDLLGGVIVGVIAVAITLLMMRTLDEPGRAGQVAVRTVAAALVVAALALLFGVPSAVEAGRLLGVSAGLVYVVWSGAPDRVPLTGRLLRLLVAAPAYLLVLWLTSLGFHAMGAESSRAAVLAAYGLATTAILAGPLALERLTSPSRAGTAG